MDELGHSGARGIALDFPLEFGGKGSSRTLQLPLDLAENPSYDGIRSTVLCVLVDAS